MGGWVEAGGYLIPRQLRGRSSDLTRMHLLPLECTRGTGYDIAQPRIAAPCNIAEFHTPRRNGKGGPEHRAPDLILAVERIGVGICFTLGICNPAREAGARQRAFGRFRAARSDCSLFRRSRTKTPAPGRGAARRCAPSSSGGARNSSTSSSVRSVINCSSCLLNLFMIISSSVSQSWRPTVSNLSSRVAPPAALEG